MLFCRCFCAGGMAFGARFRLENFGSCFQRSARCSRVAWICDYFGAVLGCCHAEFLAGGAAKRPSSDQGAWLQRPGPYLFGSLGRFLIAEHLVSWVIYSGGGYCGVFDSIGNGFEGS